MAFSPLLKLQSLKTTSFHSLSLSGPSLSLSYLNICSYLFFFFLISLSDLNINWGKFCFFLLFDNWSDYLLKISYREKIGRTRERSVLVFTID